MPVGMRRGDVCLHDADEFVLGLCPEFDAASLAVRRVYVLHLQPPALIGL